MGARMYPLSTALQELEPLLSLCISTVALQDPGALFTLLPYRNENLSSLSLCSYVAAECRSSQERLIVCNVGLAPLVKAGVRSNSVVHTLCLPKGFLTV